MSRTNVEIWRANFDGQLAALAAGAKPEDTIEHMAKIWDPDVELDATDATALDLKETYHGADGARQFWREWFSAWETFQVEYELRDAGESVVMLIEMRMRGRSTGIDVPIGKFAWIAKFRDGLIVHAKIYMRQAEALAAAGLNG